jgi:chaperonin GroEL
MTPNAHGLRSNTTETAVVEKPADADEHEHGHHHGHAH